MEDELKQRRNINQTNLKFIISFAICVCFIPFFIKNPYFIGTGVFLGIHFIIIMGLTLFVGFAGQVSIGHGAFYGIGAYTAGILTAKYALSPWVGLPSALFLTGLVAYLIGLPTLKLRGHYLALATLAFCGIVETILVEWVSMTGGGEGLINIPKLKIFGFKFTSDLSFFYLVWSIAFFVMWVSFNLVNSRTGRALKSLSDSEIGAKSLGINTSRYKNSIFVLSALYAALAGWLTAHYVGFVSPASFGVDLSIFMISMVIIGSKGSIWGSFLGAVIYTILPELLRAQVDLQIIIYGLILMVIMIILPNGVVFGIRDLWEEVGGPRYISNIFSRLRTVLGG